MWSHIDPRTYDATEGIGPDFLSAGYDSGTDCAYHPMNLVCQINVQRLEIVKASLNTLKWGDGGKLHEAFDCANVLLLLAVGQMSPSNVTMSSNTFCWGKMMPTILVVSEDLYNDGVLILRMQVRQ